MYKKRFLPGLFIVLSFAFAACDFSGGRANSDEVHLATDWSSPVKLVVQTDQVQDDVQELEIVSFDMGADVQLLSDQLFGLAFTDEISVYGPSLFGEIDLSEELKPEAVLNMLKQYDTIFYEDLETGLQKDTVVDLSFTSSTVSAMALHFVVAPSGESIVEYASLGKQVFYPETGKFRGIADKLFLGFEETEANVSTEGYADNLQFRADSNGVLYPSYFRIYSEQGRSFQEYIESIIGPFQTAEVSFDLRFDYSGKRMLIENLKVVPVADATMTSS